jgi:uncharacterized protein YfaP (DUF2135 family)
MFKHNKWVAGVVGVLVLATVVGCSVSSGSSPGGGQYIRFTILGKSFTFLFGEAGKIDVRSNQPMRRAAALRLFEEDPRETPPSGQMQMRSSDCGVARLLSSKEAIRAQEPPLQGTVTIRFSIASGESAALCDSATFLSEYTLNVNNGVVAIADEVYELSQAALAIIVTNDVTLCIDVTATFDVTITLTQFSLTFGGGEGNGNGNDNGGPTQDTGTATGQVVNAITGVPVAGATVTVSGTGLSTTTDSGGAFSMANVPEGARTIVVTATGFVESSTAVVVLANATTNTQVGLVPVGEGGNAVTIVLAWGATPSDLDLHLSGPDGSGGRFHAYFDDRNPVEHAFLDLDDQTSYGPETMTIRPTASGDFVAGDYHVWVHNYSTSPEFNTSEARVTVTASGSQLAQYNVSDATGDPALDIWYVVNLTVSAEGAVTGVNVQQTFMEGNAGTTP